MITVQGWYSDYFQKKSSNVPRLGQFYDALSVAAHEITSHFVLACISVSGVLFVLNRRKPSRETLLSKILQDFAKCNGTFLIKFAVP